MGITIYYFGKAKSPEAFGELLECLADRSSSLHWPVKAVDQDWMADTIQARDMVTVTPLSEEVLRNNVEFLPRMVKPANVFFGRRSLPVGCKKLLADALLNCPIFSCNSS